ncbi:YHS domain-containing protein [Ekhidna lutea]|uniref:YHS domain-containing protein n=1 Tax=Ekhidna lutea TaxID=447679 RepID=A0A239EJA8_EKHLU|nr:YHS domain-containing (seleno)protein [Ekhidna lutea]SNS43982.1 YHS domain-containing protein [Ekhidna lutea]
MRTATSILLIAFCFIASAQKSPVYTTNDGAIKGYDPVAYFKNGEPVKGSESFSFEWTGVEWRFSSQENLEAFKAEPEQYAPQFGGYCAYAVGNGYTYESSPMAWRIVDGKLYLNYSKGIQKKWEADRDALIKKAEENWPGVVEE